METPLLLLPPLLLLLLRAHAAQPHKGLSCVNDFVNNVSCTWTSSSAASDLDCSVSGLKETWVFINDRRLLDLIKRSCKLNRFTNSSPGCSFVFETTEFHPIEHVPITLECNGTQVENLTDYKPYNHIKMQPPGVPNVSVTANNTWIWWSPGSPRSTFLEAFDFQVQIKQKSQTWTEAKTLSTQEQQLRMSSQQLKGHGRVRVRVRVRPSEPPSSHWSDWSPTTSWVGATDVDVEPPRDRDWLWIIRPVLWSSCLFIFILIVYKTCSSRRIKRTPVPDPSQYFHTLHSVHEGNLKEWLNPLPVSESFFTAQPCDHISPVEVCESWDVAPCTSLSSSSSSALLPCRSLPSVGSETSGIVDDSSSSSCFSNMGYFMSGSSGTSARTYPSPAYFTYQEDFHNLNKGHNLHLSFCPSLGTSPAYETLKREPQSPDSGFGIEGEDENQQHDGDMEAETTDASDDPQTSPLFLLPPHPPTKVCPPSSALAPPPPASDTPQVDAPVAAAAGGSYAAWPTAGAMCRSSSMPVEPCKTGYLSLKELQTTFSNKSI